MCVCVASLSFSLKKGSFISVIGCRDNQNELYVWLEGQLPHGLDFHVTYSIQEYGCILTPLLIRITCGCKYTIYIE